MHLTHSSKKNKSLIEVFSLALNFTVLFFAILVFLSNALIDVNHQSEMQRINTSFFLPNGDIINSAQVPLPLEYVLSKEGGDNIIADYTKKHTVIYDGKQLNDVLLHQVSSNFFTNFNISTSPLAELSQNEVHISKKFNDLYLNISNSAGKKIHIKNVGVFNIASIFEHEPSSSLKPDIISSLNLKTLANYKSEQDNWYDTHINLFVKSDGKFKVTENKLKKLIKLYAPNLPGAPFTAQEFIKFNLTSLKNIHYDSGFSDEIVNTTPEYINFIVAAITLFTLISVTISYISSNTVLFLNNKPSISIKIAIGASFKQLLTEVVKNERFKLFQIMLIKSFLVMLIIPFFFDEFLMARVLTTVNVISVFLITTIMLLLFVFTIKFVSLHTIYKSISNPVISRFQSARSISIYKIFNSFQIFLASLIIFFGISIGAEMNTLYKAEFGFSTQNLYIMDLDGDIELSSSLKFDLKNSSDSIVSYSDWRPFIDSKNIITIEHSKQLQEEQLVSFNVINSDENFIAAMGLSTVIGESSKVTSSLSHEVKNVVVTEEFLNKFSRINKDNILNQKFYVENDGRKIELNIQKVVDNFHLSMPQKKYQPIVIFIENLKYNHLLINTQSEVLLTQSKAIENNNSLMPFNALYKEQFQGVFTILRYTLFPFLLSVTLVLFSSLTNISYELQRYQDILKIMEFLGSSIYTNFLYLLKKNIFPIVIAVFFSYVFGKHLAQLQVVKDVINITEASHSMASVGVLMFFSIVLCQISYLFIMSEVKRRSRR